MMPEVLAQFACGDMTILYPWDATTGRVGLWLVPTSLVPNVVSRRAVLGEMAVQRLPGGSPKAWAIESLIQIHVLSAAPPPGFAQGRTLRNSPTVQLLRYVRRGPRMSSVCNLYQ